MRIHMRGGGGGGSGDMVRVRVRLCACVRYCVVRPSMYSNSVKK